MKKPLWQMRLRVWLLTIEAWSDAIEVARRMDLPSDLIERLFKSFPAYPEDLM